MKKILALIIILASFASYAQCPYRNCAAVPVYTSCGSGTCSRGGCPKKSSVRKKKQKDVKQADAEPEQDTKTPRISFDERFERAQSMFDDTYEQVGGYHRTCHRRYHRTCHRRYRRYRRCR